MQNLDERGIRGDAVREEDERRLRLDVCPLERRAYLLEQRRLVGRPLAWLLHPAARVMSCKKVEAPSVVGRGGSGGRSSSMTTFFITAPSLYRLPLSSRNHGLLQSEQLPRDDAKGVKKSDASSLSLLNVSGAR